MKSLLLGLALAMSAALPAMAENWVYVGTTNDGRTDSSIDVDSISPFNGGYWQILRELERSLIL
ncbi:MAG: YgdI/YgdR family lipoprotein [Nostoc sp.]